MGKKDGDGRKRKLLKICCCYCLKYFCVDNYSIYKSITLVKQVNKCRDMLQKKRKKAREKKGKDIENV